MDGIRWWASGPLVWVAVRGCGDEDGVGVFGDGAFLAVYDERLRGSFGGRFGDADYGGDEAEFFVHDGTGHAAEEFGDVSVVVPLAGGPALEDFVEVGLKMALSGNVHGKECEAEVDGVGCGFVACEDEYEGVAENILFGQGLLGGFSFGFRFCGDAGTFDHCYHKVQIVSFRPCKDCGFLRSKHLVLVFPPFIIRDICRLCPLEG